MLCKIIHSFISPRHHSSNALRKCQIIRPDRAPLSTVPSAWCRDHGQTPRSGFGLDIRLGRDAFLKLGTLRRSLLILGFIIVDFILFSAVLVLLVAVVVALALDILDFERGILDTVIALLGNPCGWSFEKSGDSSLDDLLGRVLLASRATTLLRDDGHGAVNGVSIGGTFFGGRGIEGFSRVTEALDTVANGAWGNSWVE